MNGDPLQVTNRRENWVKFNDNDNAVENGEQKTTENVVISIPTPSPPPRSQSPSSSSRKSSSISMQSKKSDMHVIDLSNIKPSIKQIVDFKESETDTTPAPQQLVFKNGDLIVQVSSEKGRFCWITPARFRPELVPEEILDRQLSITVEEYVQVVEQLVNDNRFHMYNIFYKKLLGFWILVAFIIMFSLLLLQLEGMMLFFLGVVWLIMNLFAIFATTVCKDYLNRNLEKCLANINLQLLPHKMLVGVDNPGALSCHKMKLNFIYYDPKACLDQLHDLIKQQESNPLNVINANGGWESQLDVNKCHIMIQNDQSTRVTRSQTRIEQCLLRYSQSWVKNFLRKRLDFPQVRVLFDVYDLNTDPRHLERGFCLCQYVEMILRDKAHTSGAGSFEKFINTIWPRSQPNNNRNFSTATASLPVQAIIAGVRVA